MKQVCPYCERDVEVVIGEKIESGGVSVQCSFCKKTWTESSLKKNKLKK